MIDYRDLLTCYVRSHGPIPTVRVSSAQARGRAKNYAYWGTVRYEIRLTSDGRLTHTPLERANSDRRSERLAQEDAFEIARAENRSVLESAQGSITDAEVKQVLFERGLIPNPWSEPVSA